MAVLMLACVLAFAGCGGSMESDVVIHWNTTTGIDRTTPTLQVVVNPQFQPGQPLGAAAFSALQYLGADYTRYQLWFPYPKLAVAELQAPTSNSTSWDFSLIDPMMNGFMRATDGHPTVMDFSTIPQWMFVTDKAVGYPSDPNQQMWDYEQGTQLRDPTCTELADYYARLASWYVNGGFTDEIGVWHQSGHRYQLPLWEVLNEPDLEHSTTAEEYTRRYDAIVEAVRRVSPETKFVALALGQPAYDLDFVRYFLNPANHLPDIPIDYISYHFYAVPGLQETVTDWQYTLFQQADDFLGTVHSVESIRRQLAPNTRTDIDELGTILPTDAPPGIGMMPPPVYWNVSASVFAYIYVNLARMQIDVLGQAQLVGFPSLYPTVSLMDWTSNRPNARFWVLKLLQDSFHPGDRLVATELRAPLTSDVEAQAFATSFGRKLLLINKRDRAIDIAIPDTRSANVVGVDQQSGENPARGINPRVGKITLQPFAVTVVSWKS